MPRRELEGPVAVDPTESRRNSRFDLVVLCLGGTLLHLSPQVVPLCFDGSNCPTEAKRAGSFNRHIRTDTPACIHTKRHIRNDQGGQKEMVSDNCINRRLRQAWREEEKTWNQSKSSRSPTACTDRGRSSASSAPLDFSLTNFLFFLCACKPHGIGDIVHRGMPGHTPSYGNPYHLGALTQWSGATN